MFPYLSVQEFKEDKYFYYDNTSGQEFQWVSGEVLQKKCKKVLHMSQYSTIIKPKVMLF